VAAFTYGPVHGFMIWNMFLAALSAPLAVVLFRHRAARSPAWWVVFAVWLLFLPNAPYVCTDVVHMVHDVQRSQSNVQAYAVLGCYGLFFAAGLSAYVFSLQLFRRFLHRIGWRALVVPALLVVHGLCMTAMYLGRFVRVNSWDAVIAPGSVAEAASHLTDGFAAKTIAVMYVVVGIGAYATAAVLAKAVAQARRLLDVPAA
jgi:uncharacterized membrane protein